MSHRGHDTQQELQYENQLEEQHERIRILQDRIFLLRLTTPLRQMLY